MAVKPQAQVQQVQAPSTLPLAQAQVQQVPVQVQQVPPSIPSAQPQAQVAVQVQQQAPSTLPLTQPQAQVQQATVQQSQDTTERVVNVVQVTPTSDAQNMPLLSVNSTGQQSEPVSGQVQEVIPTGPEFHV